MKRCTCGRPNCRLEFKYDTDPKFRAWWDAQPEPPPPPAKGEPCNGCDQPTKPAMTAPPPTLRKKVMTFNAAYQKWIDAGKPITPDAELADRRAKCNACEYRDPKKDSCKVCGCPLEKPGWAVRLLTDSPGKILMATEECPKKFWLPVVV